MNINVTFRHLEPTAALRDHAEKRIERLSKFLQEPVQADVTLSLERHLQVADIHVTAAHGLALRGKEKTDDLYASLERAVAKIEKQVLRYKSKIHEHRPVDRAEQPFRLDIVEVGGGKDAPEGEISAGELAKPPRLVKTTVLNARALTVNEAVMQMDLIDNNFLVFTNAESRELNVIYRREDGTYGVIEAHRV